MAAARCLRDRRCDGVSVGPITHHMHHTANMFPLSWNAVRIIAHNSLCTIGRVTCTSIG